ncbi:MAG: HD domain-containing protein [candidate division Zixibacteria bacterium]|nr:HD domain-containing protein [candidate division Zixibacteria bacterium]
MEKLRYFVIKHLEKILVLGLTAVILLTNYFISQKLAFLNFYYLPVLVAGYFLGKKFAVYTSLFSISLVVFLVVLYPNSFHLQSSNLQLVLDLVIWGGFLFLAAAVVGTLYEQKENKIQELKKAYVGVIEILSKYLESSDHYTKGHSLRVADFATEIAGAMDLSKNEIENIRVASLLHDIGKIEISSELITKAASLTEEERKIVETHVEKGAEILSSVGTVLKEAVPMVLSHHKFFIQNKAEEKKFGALPMGARILAVADSFDAMVTDRPYRAGKPIWQAIEELENESGNQFDPEVVEAFKKVLADKVEVV